MKLNGFEETLNPLTMLGANDICPGFALYCINVAPSELLCHKEASHGPEQRGFQAH